MSTISRRAFLKTVGVGALSIAAVSVLAGCDTVGTQTPTTDASVLAADFGRPYSIDAYSVNTEAATDAVTVTAKWFDSWKTAESTNYSNYIDDSAKTVVWKATAPESSAARAEYVKNLNDVANAKASKDLAVVEFMISNYSNEDLKIANYNCDAYTDGTAVVANGSIFSASCNGTALTCAAAIDSAAVGSSAFVGLIETATTANVKVYVALPVNVEKFTLTVAIPGTTTKFEYTVTNPEYKDLSKL